MAKSKTFPFHMFFDEATSSSQSRWRRTPSTIRTSKKDEASIRMLDGANQDTGRSQLEPRRNFLSKYVGSPDVIWVYDAEGAKIL